MHRLRRANSFSEPLTSECQTKDCMNLSESECKAHGFFCADCIANRHSACLLERIPTLDEIKDNMESVKLTLMSLKEELY